MNQVSKLCGQCLAIRVIQQGGTAIGKVQRLPAVHEKYHCVVRDEGSSTVEYGLAEALADESPRQFVPLVGTDPHFGGTRYWFRCPRPRCGRRCSVLYREQRSNARAFACRRCIRFRYRTQVLGDADLIATRIEKLLIRCELQPDGTVGRRKGMHQRTFHMLAERLECQTAQCKATSPLSRHVDRQLADLERQIAIETRVAGIRDAVASEPR